MPHGTYFGTLYNLSMGNVWPLGKARRRVAKRTLLAALSALVALPVTAASPDLRIDSIAINKSTSPGLRFRPGQKVRLDFQASNHGDSKSHRGVPLQWFFGPGPNSRAIPINQGSLGGINGLSPGEIEVETDSRWRLPQLPGKYWLTAVLDNGQGGFDVATTRLIVDEHTAPDLQITSLTVQGGGNFEPGQPIPLTIVAGNTGSEKSARNLKVAWYVSTEPSGKSFQIGEVRLTGKLPPQGETVLHDATFSTSVPGTYWLTATIDPEGKQRELTTLNNHLTTKIVVAEPAVVKTVVPEIAPAKQVERAIASITQNIPEAAPAPTPAPVITDAPALEVQTRTPDVQPKPPLPDPVLTASLEPPRFTAIGYADGQFVFEWEGEGVLEIAPTPAGPWEPVENVTSPATVRTDSPHYFFRLRIP